MRTLILIDAFNLYYSVKGHSPRGRPRAYLWLDLATFSERIRERLNIACTESKIYYFTALPNHMAGIEPEKIKRHQLFIKAQTYRGVTVCKQEFVTQTGNTYAKVQGREERSWKEKGTDVALTCRLFEEAIKDSFDHAIIVSNDADYQPAIETFHRLFPNKRLTVALTPGREGNQGNQCLRKVAKQTYTVQTKDYSECQLEEPAKIPKNKSAKRPDYWR